MKAMPADSLKNLARLLQGMALFKTDVADVFSLSPPHERVLANTLGLTGEGPLPDGLIPWAAQQAGETAGKAWAFITPCHWAMGREHATMTDPAALKLTEAESKTLLAAMQPYFSTEGISLHYAQPERWLAEGEVLRKLPSASLDRVLGRNVDRWLPGTRNIRLLQNEMQMLLYTHPLNDERSAKRQRSINSFWISGTGALGQPLKPASNMPEVPRQLAQAAFADDWAAYAQAWQALDKTEIASFLARQNAGEALTLSLCGERAAHTFKSRPRNLKTRLAGLLAPVRPISLLEQL